MTRRLARRRSLSRLLTLPAVVACLVAASACGGDDSTAEGEESSASADEPVTLSFMWWGSDARHTATQEVVDAFEAAHPNITVEVEFTSWDDYWDRLGTTVAGGDTPDVIQMDGRYIREYAANGVLADLSPYVGDTIDDSAFDPSVADIATIDDQLVSLPTGVNAYAVVANPTIIEQSGVTLPDDSEWTWEEFAEVAAAVSTAGGGSYYGTQNFNYTETAFEIFARQHGETMFNEDGTLGFEADTLREWWEYIVGLRTGGAEPSPELTVESQAAGLDQSLISTNRSAFGGQWTNQLAAVSGAAGVDMELLRWPGESDEAGMYLKPAMFYSVAADSEHPTEAAMLIDFLLNSEEAAQVILSDRGLPLNTELRETIAPQLSATDQQSLEFLEEITPDLGESPALPPEGAGEVEDILAEINEQVLFDQLSVDEAVEQFMSRAEEVTAG